MAELPEIIILSRQMNDRLAGRTLEAAELGQVKSLNRPAGEFQAALLGRSLDQVRGHGKWLVLDFSRPGPNLLIHPGMGMDLLDLSINPSTRPQFFFRFDQGAGFSLRFWWFGYLRLAEPGQELSTAGDPGPAPLSSQFTPAVLAERLALKKQTNLKAFLLDQKNLAGIGNVYVQDICFRIRAHPGTKLADLTAGQREGLYPAIQETLGQAASWGINRFELDFLGRTGQWDMNRFLVGYKTGQPCPVCGQAIVKIKAAGSASYICPNCQSLPKNNKKSK